MLLDHLAISLLQEKNTPAMPDLSYCKLRRDALREITLSRHVLGGRFQRQELVTAALHTFLSLGWPKHIQTPAGHSFIAGAPECCSSIWTAANDLVSTATCVFSLCLCSYVHTYCIHDWKWYTLIWMSARLKLNILNLCKGHVVQQEQKTEALEQKAEFTKCFERKLSLLWH